MDRMRSPSRQTRKSSSALMFAKSYRQFKSGRGRTNGFPPAAGDIEMAPREQRRTLNASRRPGGPPRSMGGPRPSSGPSARGPPRYMGGPPEPCCSRCVIVAVTIIVAVIILGAVLGICWGCGLLFSNKESTPNASDGFRADSAGAYPPGAGSYQPDTHPGSHPGSTGQSSSTGEGDAHLPYPKFLDPNKFKKKEGESFQKPSTACRRWFAKKHRRLLVGSKRRRLPSDADFTFPAGEWNCSACTTANTDLHSLGHQMQACSICQTPRPKTNAPTAQTAAPSTNAAPPAPRTTAAASTDTRRLWKCPKCKFPNEAHFAHCAKKVLGCKGKRPCVYVSTGNQARSSGTQAATSAAREAPIVQQTATPAPKHVRGWILPLIDPDDTDNSPSPFTKGQLHNIPTALNNVCWLAAFLEVLGQSKVSDWIEKRKNGDGFYRDLTLTREKSGDTETFKWRRKKKAAENARTRQMRELLRLATNYMLGRYAPEKSRNERYVDYNKTPTIGSVVRTIAKAIDANTYSVTAGGQNDGAEGIHKFLDWLQVWDLFGWVETSTVSCDVCSFKRAKVIRSTDPLCLNLQTGTTTLKSSYADWSQVETLTGDNKYMCDKCNKKQDGKKQLQATNIKEGQALTFMMKRFKTDDYGQNPTKINSPVDFPLQFTHSFDGKTNVKATLVSTLEHSGTLKRGHYITRAKLKGDGSWFGNILGKKRSGWAKFNNLSTSKPPMLSGHGANQVSRDAYMLFYIVTDVSDVTSTPFDTMLKYSVPVIGGSVLLYFLLKYCVLSQYCL